MKTKFTLAATLALTLLTVTAVLVTAAPTMPGPAGESQSNNAPILPRNAAKAHSDAWSDFYFDRNVATELPSNFEIQARGQWRGGLAGLHSPLAKPILPKNRVQAHSDTWNDKHFDQTVSASLNWNVAESFDPGLRRGGSAK